MKCVGHVSRMGCNRNVYRVLVRNHERRKPLDKLLNFMFEFPCILSLYYIENQQDATLAGLFISNCKITLHVSDAFCLHHQEY